jgi:hypothetical protein
VPKRGMLVSSKAVIALMRPGKLDEAESAAREFLVRYDRLGMVYKARGRNKQAADCYRQDIQALVPGGEVQVCTMVCHLEGSRERSSRAPGFARHIRFADKTPSLGSVVPVATPTLTSRLAQHAEHGSS